MVAPPAPPLRPTLGGIYAARTEGVTPAPLSKAGRSALVDDDGAVLDDERDVEQNEDIRARIAVDEH